MKIRGLPQFNQTLQDLFRWLCLIVLENIHVCIYTVLSDLSMSMVGNRYLHPNPLSFNRESFSWCQLQHSSFHWSYWRWDCAVDSLYTPFIQFSFLSIKSPQACKETTSFVCVLMFILHSIPFLLVFEYNFGQHAHDAASCWCDFILHLVSL